MLYGPLIHPEILRALGSAGHGATVLIADGNYPFSTGARPDAPCVFLNLAPGMLGATDVLRVLAEAIPIEAATVMMPNTGSEPPIFEEFRHLLPSAVSLTLLERFAFYEQARGKDLALIIATGEQRIYANILLTIGVVPPPA